MKVLITGALGFVGSVLAESWLEAQAGVTLYGIDNLSRPGSETNRKRLQRSGMRFIHGDVRLSSDLEALPQVDWVIDASANPTVLAGVQGCSSRQLMEHNLIGTVNLLEYCKRSGAGLILISTSRVYSIAALSALPVVAAGNAFRLESAPLPPGASLTGIGETFSTASPVSLYGAAKLASETLALEYGASFGFPVWVNRCGLLAGAGQFGRGDQGILSYWINAWLRRRPLTYLGFGGSGHQVRDCLHPRDLVPLFRRQIADSSQAGSIFNVGGGKESAISLAQLSDWCRVRFGEHQVGADLKPRRFDVPWLVLDSARADAAFGWEPATPLAEVLEEIARHAEAHPDWLEIGGGG